MKSLCFLGAVFLLTFGFQAHADSLSEKELLQSLHLPKHFALIRHALAPGFGDPENFRIGERKTQRNLSEEGRQQARKIGKLSKSHGIARADVYSSQWFRCLETAELLDLGEVQSLPVLNSFFQDFSKEAEQTTGVKNWLLQHEFSKPLILVTHQVNITALTGVYPASGEILIVKIDGDSFQVLGRIETL